MKARCPDCGRMTEEISDVKWVRIGNDEDDTAVPTSAICEDCGEFEVVEKKPHHQFKIGDQVAAKCNIGLIVSAGDIGAVEYVSSDGYIYVNFGSAHSVRRFPTGEFELVDIKRTEMSNMYWDIATPEGVYIMAAPDKEEAWKRFIANRATLTPQPHKTER